jgi:hypothetical protein
MHIARQITHAVNLGGSFIPGCNEEGEPTAKDSDREISPIKAIEIGTAQLLYGEKGLCFRAGETHTKASKIVLNILTKS